ncbi:hypothetical protein ABRG53_d084 (plasmid) [Pseudanabaena sp. ABRG5-3]|nr:hypothetical protein ABRG53_d084 [Pseudanabaena sp. ABRG5-3]
MRRDFFFVSHILAISHIFKISTIVLKFNLSIRELNSAIIKSKYLLTSSHTQLRFKYSFEGIDRHLG